MYLYFLALIRVFCQLHPVYFDQCYITNRFNACPVITSACVGCVAATRVVRRSRRSVRELHVRQHPADELFDQAIVPKIDTRCRGNRSTGRNVTYRVHLRSIIAQMDSRRHRQCRRVPDRNISITETVVPTEYSK